MARGGLGWGVRDLAAKAKVSVETIVRFENGERLRDQTLGKMRAALEKAGVEFIDENGGGPGVRLAKRKGKKRGK
jgi:ribosome-binding protein aMBF1 (putative translation factor)